MSLRVKKRLSLIDKADVKDLGRVCQCSNRNIFNTGLSDLANVLQGYVAGSLELCAPCIQSDRLMYLFQRHVIEEDSVHVQFQSFLHIIQRPGFNLDIEA